MPKGNPGRLKSRFEIRGEATPNEYEFQQHHGELTEQEHETFPPAEGDEGEAAKKSRSVGKSSGAKKSATKKASGKTSAKKGSSKKSAKRS